jgi:AcrR family transcriptional regulator
MRNMAELGAPTGVGNCSIYHHFGSKKGVISALLAEIILGYQDTVLAVLDRHVKSATPARCGLQRPGAPSRTWTTSPSTSPSSSSPGTSATRDPVGTNYPMLTAEQALADLAALELDAEAAEKINSRCSLADSGQIKPLFVGL